MRGMLYTGQTNNRPLQRTEAARKFREAVPTLLSFLLCAGIGRRNLSDERRNRHGLIFLSLYGLYAFHCSTSSPALQSPAVISDNRCG